MHLESVDDAKNVAGFSDEFFAPVLVVAHLSVANELSSAEREKLQAPSNGNALDGDADDAALQALCAAFLKQGVELVNKHMWGNLCAALYVPPAVQSALKSEVQAAVDALRCGAVAVNRGTFAPAMMPQGMWGGYQGADTSMANPRSGVGAAYNTMLFDHPQKQALWFDFKPDAELAMAGPIPALVAKPLVGALTGGVAGVLTALQPF